MPTHNENFRLRFGNKDGAPGGSDRAVCRHRLCVPPMKNLLVTIAALFIAACTITRPAHLYDLDTGDVLAAEVDTHGTGHGEIRVFPKDETVLTGEFSVVRQDMLSSSHGHASGEFGGQFGWATAQGFTVTQSRAVVGSAVVAGGGKVIDVLFQVD